MADSSPLSEELLLIHHLGSNSLTERSGGMIILPPYLRRAGANSENRALFVF